MRTSNVLVVIFTCLLLVVSMGCAESQKTAYKWDVHDMSRPQPPVVEPAVPSTQERVGKAPSDAIVLFDGSSLDEWVSDGGAPAKWQIIGDYMQVVPKTGTLTTKRSFGSCQLHIEWASPTPPHGEGQHRANSGVFLMGKYEVQVLDSYGSETYADGQAAALYGQKPPAVNACRPAGQWQSYDIVFHRPVFDGDKVVRPATITMFHNGVLVHDNYELKGTTWHKRRSHYEPHAESLPMQLQDHGNPVKYRNIWIRPLED